MTAIIEYKTRGGFAPIQRRRRLAAMAIVCQAFAVSRLIAYKLAVYFLPYDESDSDGITVVKPETAIRWHRRGVRAYWRWKSLRCGGRPRIAACVSRVVRGNPSANDVDLRISVCANRKAQTDPFSYVQCANLRPKYYSVTS